MVNNYSHGSSLTFAIKLASTSLTPKKIAKRNREPTKRDEDGPLVNHLVVLEMKKVQEMLVSDRL